MVASGERCTVCDDGADVIAGVVVSTDRCIAGATGTAESGAEVVGVDSQGVRCTDGDARVSAGVVVSVVVCAARCTIGSTGAVDLGADTGIEATGMLSTGARCTISVGGTGVTAGIVGLDDLCTGDSDDVDGVDATGDVADPSESVDVRCTVGGTGVEYAGVAADVVVSTARCTGSSPGVADRGADTGIETTAP
jgi:hypothetical protein